jgi:hypothetical protein
LSLFQVQKLKKQWDEFTHEDHEHEGLLEADLKEHEELTKVQGGREEE